MDNTIRAKALQTLIDKLKESGLRPESKITNIGTYRRYSGLEYGVIVYFNDDEFDFLKVIVYDSSSDELCVCSKLSNYLTKDDIINICKDIFSSYNLKISLCTKIV